MNVIILSFHPLDHIWTLVSILQSQHILEPHSAPMISTLRSQLKNTQFWGGLWQMESRVPGGARIQKAENTSGHGTRG